MADIVTTITYTERFFHDVRMRYDVKSSTTTADDGFATYQEAVEDAAKFGVQAFTVNKVYVRVPA